jgi:hypothetical protein
LDTVGPVLLPESPPLLRLDEEEVVSVVVFRVELLIVDLNKTNKPIITETFVEFEMFKQKSNMLISN